MLWVYRNTPHESTGSFLLFGRDLRSPVEAELQALVVKDYKEQMLQTLAVRTICVIITGVYIVFHFLPDLVAITSALSTIPIFQGVLIEGFLRDL